MHLSTVRDSSRLATMRHHRGVAVATAPGAHAPFSPLEEADAISKNLSSRFSLRGGEHSVRTLTTALSVASCTRPGELSQAELTLALSTLNVVAGHAPAAVAALFARHDTLGAGFISTSALAAAVLGEEPSLETTQQLRGVAAAFRRALSTAGGVHAVRTLCDELATAAGGPDAPLSRREARDMCAAALGPAAAGEALDAVLREATRCNEYATLVPRVFAELLRGPLSQRARSLIVGLWRERSGGSGGVSSPPLPLARLAPIASSPLLEAWELLWRGVDASARVPFEAWLDYCRDMRAGVGSDDALEELLAREWGGGGRCAPSRAGPPMGTPSAAWRGRAIDRAATYADSAAALRRGDGPGEGLMPIVFSTHLGRAQPIVGTEELFGKGATRVIRHEVPALPFGAHVLAGNAVPRPVGTTFRAGANERFVGAHGGVIAASYASSRNARTISAFVRGR